MQGWFENVLESHLTWAPDDIGIVPCWTWQASAKAQKLHWTEPPSRGNETVGTMQMERVCQSRLRDLRCPKGIQKDPKGA